MRGKGELGPCRGGRGSSQPLPVTPEPALTRSWLTSHGREGCTAPSHSPPSPFPSFFLFSLRMRLSVSRPGLWDPSVFVAHPFLPALPSWRQRQTRPRPVLLPCCSARGPPGEVSVPSAAAPSRRTGVFSLEKGPVCPRLHRPAAGAPSPAHS